MKQLRTYFSKFSFAFILSLIVGLSASAQTYPVQTTVSTTAPYLNYLSYYGDQNNHLQIMVTKLDFNTPPLLVRLRIRIEGPGYELYTNPNAVIGQPFLLEAGMPLVISGIELLPYLQQSNLINPSNVDLNDLPHGFTTICVDVVNESAQQQILSANSCGFIPIQEYQPPQAFVPSCGDQLDTNTMFHNFTWTPPVPFPAGAGLDVFYDFSIHHWIDPNNNSALGGNSILVYQENDLIAPTTQVSDFDIQWEIGGTYIWTVTARVESNGMPISLIENGGVSAPCTFVYGEELSLADQLADGLEIQLFTEPSAERKGKAWWTVIDNTPNQGLSTFDEFFIEYRKQPTGNEGFEIPWFSKTLTSFEHFIYQLEPSTTYEVKVSGVIAGVVGDPTPVETFTTPDPRVYNCGESDLPYLPSTYTPLENATVGTQVQIGQFTMTITQLNELGGGHYSGKGTIPIAFLAGARAKVRFDDILIDTEYRVHEGRVDVITDGLDNWLNEQYQQFIDPYYVNGTIDSAWVDTVAGVAWVTVNGVNYDFPFDPPNYPVIVNDENGNQYTIYPDGTIVIGTFLAISETWNVMPDEVIHFGQNESELRGFDPKEHIQWHENYEVMMLGDSSKYFVANKSLAKDEGDKVNVEIPAGVSASFEFADGTPVTDVDLQGNWIGTPQHNGSTKRTLNIPARSSTGSYSIYAFANNQKVGQLNIKVYSKKERELVVVPIATTNLTASQIKEELDNTLGEANLDVDVEITPQWTDNTGTFTASTTIAMPTEVGLLNKYSDDMRAIRDLYFEQNPNADKSKYYLFVVNGFDDPNEVGYMVRGRAMGFVKASQSNILQTISHELGHGMGALEHTFKHNSFEKGDTENLMDYSANPTNLTKAQWKELRDFDLAPSLWDGTEDAQNAVVAVNDYDLTEFLNPDGSITFATPSGKPISLKGSISELTFQTLSFFGGHGSLEEGIEQPPFGSLVAFTIDGTAYTMDINETGQFLGYFNPSDSTGTAYSETYSQNNDGVKMCVGLPVFMNGEFGLGVTRCDLAITNISGANTAIGTKQEIEWLIDNYCNNLQANSTHVLVANIDYNTDFTEELILLGELMEVIDAHANLSGIQVNTANGASYEQGHYFGVSAYLIFKLLKMINLNKDAIPCTQFLGERLDDYFNAQLSSQAYQQALATHYSSPINQALEGEYLDIKVQPEVFTQSTSYTDITLVNSASQGVEFLMGLTNPTDINILKRNMILKHFFSQQEQLLNTDNSVNFTFIDNLKAKLHSALYNNQTINEDQRLEVRCLLAGLNYNQRSSLIDYCFSQMNSPTATGTNRAPYAEIVLGALEIAPPSQYSQLRTLISANGYSYYNQLANLVTPNKLYENSSAAFATWVVNGLTSQKARAIRVIDRYARDKNQVIENSFDPSLSASVNGVEFVPLIPMSILHGMSDPIVTSSYSAGSNTYTFHIDLGTETTVTVTPFDLIQVEVMENFNNSYVVRPDNGQPLKQGDKFLIPASTLHNIIQQNELAVYNVGLKYMLEAAFIAGTGGTGLGMLALEVSVMSAQLIIEDNMGDIQYMPESPTKNMILGFRDYADYIVAGAGISKMMLNGVQRSPFIIKEQIGNDFKFTFKSNEKGMVLSRLDEAGELSANITKIRGILNTMDDVTDVGLVTVKKHLEAFELDTRFLQITRNTGAHKVHFSPISKKPYFHYIANEYNPTAFTPKDLFSVEFIANNSKARLTNIQWLSASYSGDVVLVSRMKNTNYQPPGESQFVDGRLEVVKTNTGQLYVRIPEFDVLLSSLRDKFDGHSNLLAWLDEIPEAKINLLKELDQLPSSSYADLDGDIFESSVLTNEFANNGELLKGWEVLQTSGVTNTVRRDIDKLTIVEKHLDETGETISNVSNQISSKGGFDDWTQWIIENAGGRKALKTKLINYGYPKCGDAVSDASNVSARNKSKLHLDTDIPNAVNDYSYTINGNTYIKGTSESWKDYFARLKASPDLNGFESHHIFPVTLFKNKSFRKWYEEIGSNSFSMNGENILENLIMLEKKTGGRGVHSNHPIYTSVIGTYLDSRFNTYLGQNYTEIEALALLDDDIMNLRSNLKAAILENSVRNSVELSTFWTSIQFNTLIN